MVEAPKPAKLSRTLVVEDERVARVAMTKILQALGHEVHTAATIKEALEKLTLQPQRILLDLMLPDGIGIEVLRRIRDNQLPIKVAVTSATVDPALLADVARLAPDAFFHKPIRLPDITRWLMTADAAVARPLAG